MKQGNRPRRDDPYAARPDFHRLQRQASFDFHEGLCFLKFEYLVPFVRQMLDTLF